MNTIRNLVIICLIFNSSPTMNNVKSINNVLREKRTKKTSCFNDCISFCSKKIKQTTRYILNSLKIIDCRKQKERVSSYKRSRFSDLKGQSLTDKKEFSETSPMAHWFKTRTGLESFYLKTNVIGNTSIKSSKFSPTSKNKLKLVQRAANPTNKNLSTYPEDEILIQIREEISKLESIEKEILEDKESTNIFIDKVKLEDKLEKIRNRMSKHKEIEKDYIFKLRKMEMIKNKTKEIYKSNKNNIWNRIKRALFPKTKDQEINFIKKTLVDIQEYKTVIESNELYAKATQNLIQKMFLNLSKDREFLINRYREENRIDNGLDFDDYQVSKTDTNKAFRKEASLEHDNSCMESDDCGNKYLINYNKSEEGCLCEDEREMNHLLEVQNRINTVHRLEKELKNVKKEIADDTNTLKKLTEAFYNTKYISKKLENIDFEEELASYGVFALKSLNRRFRTRTGSLKI